MSDFSNSTAGTAPPAYPELNTGSNTAPTASGTTYTEKANGALHFPPTICSKPSPTHIDPSHLQEHQSNMDTLTTAAANAANSIQNNQTVQQLANGPAADKVRGEATATKNEFSNLAAARTVPDAQTATGQNLTSYHSLFYSLLSWENPRATAISFVAIVTTIIVARYVPVDRYVLKALFTVLGITAAAEIAGQMAFGQGFATKMRPKKYYTIPRETLESVLGDVEQLVNFFVIEFQRIIFAENVYATLAAFLAALISYFLVKVTPKWGLLLLSTSVVYLAPLIYIKNKDFIDSHLNNAAEIANKQTQQLRDIAAQQSNRAVEVASSTTSQYVSKAQELMGGAKKSAVDGGYVSKDTANAVPGVPVEKASPLNAQTSSSPLNSQTSGSSFPSAPKTELPSLSNNTHTQTPIADEFKAAPASNAMNEPATKKSKESIRVGSKKWKREVAALPSPVVHFGELPDVV
ncbi:hypothetical protein B0A48_04563 [Cryoendolithus antarcticus]|uniref:Reticulon-like protein n=1 Tax=Cryoendolithus antarcticus TaxID=1507870 RepID=A0A1V8TFQ3_9PEZI|nr:hypothetical protein B0A48_04563 [Cryoendolithus antarcticus]